MPSTINNKHKDKNLGKNTHTKGRKNRPKRNENTGNSRGTKINKSKTK